MAQHLLKFFTPITSIDTQVLIQSECLLLKNHFNFISGENSKEQVMLGMTKNYLLLMHNYQGQQLNYFCHLGFNLKFQVIRGIWVDQKNPGTPLGLRFDQDIPSERLQFFNNDAEIVYKWLKQLQNKINQRNFHQLFKAKKKIGKGAFATVYLAQRLLDKKMVAVKAFSKEKQFSGQKGKQSLQNQIKIMRGINHENITKLEEVYQTQNSIYVILDCLQGKQLNEQIKAGRSFSYQQSVTIIKQILRGLAHLSSKRIIHRDLKPENIMFKQKNCLDISICDFGLATYADQQKYLFVRCGTPGFVAPQIINLKDMNAKSQPISDVFSAGIIAHQLFLGHSIFNGKRYNEVLAENRACKFDFTQSKYQQIPIQALNLLIAMLEKNPQKRISAQVALKMPIFNSQLQEQRPHTQPFVQIQNRQMMYPILSQKQNKTIEYQRNIKNNNSNINKENSLLSNFSGFNIGQTVKGKMPSLSQYNSSFIMNNRINRLPI